MEIINYPNRSFKYALFDFDGTVSLLREGWQGVMVPYFVEELTKYTENPNPEEITHTVTEFVDVLTGKQTIFQCMRLNEEIQKRGGPPEDPYRYKAEYLRRLFALIKGRHASIQSGGDKTPYLVPGVEAFLQGLQANGVKLYLASGTDEADVIAEAELLGVADYFNGGIYGARDAVTDCSKELVIKQIINENNISGGDLASFGDGYIELQLVKEIGGYAVAVATNEDTRTGVNQWKRKRLLSAGADAVIGDFTQTEALLNLLIRK
jgi:phosphoglycolate phosphatase-like HAD superfamily hydrolase